MSQYFVRRIKTVFSYVFLFIVAALPLNLFAQFGDPHTKVSVISEVKSIQPGKSFWVAVRLKMDDHWHIYWRNPGDTGLETAVEWQLPEGFTVGELQWPAPERIEEPPLVIYGYHGEIFLLSKIYVPKDVDAGSIVRLKAKVGWLECDDVCIPGEGEVELELPVKPESPQADTRWQQIFADARIRLPRKTSDWEFSAAKENEYLLIQAAAPEWFKDNLGTVSFFPYGLGIIDNIAKQVLKQDGNVFRLKVKLAENAELRDTLSGIMVSENGWRGPNSERAIEINLIISDQLSAIPRTTTGSEISSIWLALIFSFLGGIILNLMPCVLPVLSIKIMGIINQAHDEHNEPWKHGWVFTFGVLVSFWALAGALLILKAGGAQLGWGFQLQEPVFIIFLAVFMFLFGLSMFGVFEIGTSLTTIEGKTQGKTGYMGSFISGVTATIVATPCTAPFMGSALGFALAQPAWASMLVFTFLGLGMASPFVLLSSVPALLKFIPKPGRWMESLKQFMGFLLVATVLWLLWVLGMQAGSNAVIIVLFNLLFAAIAGWIYGRWGHLAMPAKTRMIAVSIAAIILIASNVYVFSSIDKYAVTPAAAAESGHGINWQPFEQEKVDRLVAEGKPVFIDFTAAWCLSCQVNEQVAFSSEEVQNKFKEKNIYTFKADWTARDERIAKALAKFGRNSVPLYVLFDGNGGEPKLLPEIITPGIILNALESVK